MKAIPEWQTEGFSSQAAYFWHLTNLVLDHRKTVEIDQRFNALRQAEFVWRRETKQHFLSLLAQVLRTRHVVLRIEALKMLARNFNYREIDTTLWRFEQRHDLTPLEHDQLALMKSKPNWLFHHLLEAS